MNRVLSNSHSQKNVETQYQDKSVLHQGVSAKLFPSLDESCLLNACNYATGHVQKNESCQRHESFAMTSLSGEIMDDIIPHHNQDRIKDASLVDGDDSVHYNAFCLAPIWDEIDQSACDHVRAPSRQSSTQHTLKWLSSILHQSPTLCALLDDVDIDDWGFVISKDSSQSYKIDIEHDVVVLPSLLKKTHSRHNLLINMVRALRDMWYEDNHFDLYETLQPEEWLKWERLRSADIESFTVLVCWELRIAGERELWRTLMGSDIGDMAMIFQAIHEQTTSFDFNKSPLLHTFRQWFMVEDRINHTDSITLSAIDDSVLNDTNLESFGQDCLDGTDVEERLSLPQEGAYLEDMAIMLNHPNFCQIPDDINQAHLFHIMNDLDTVQVSGVRFRDKSLAAKIFPKG